MPGWPTVPHAEFTEKDIGDREVIDLAESKFTADVGKLKGYDYFGDGSFYILNAPGVRTSTPFEKN